MRPPATDDRYPANEIELALLYGVFSLLLVVIVLNALIAIMGDTYDKVMEHQRPRALLERAQLLLEIERGMSAAQRRNKAFFPAYVHAIILDESDENEYGWAGRMHAMRQMLDKMHNAQQAESKERHSEINAVTALIENQSQKLQQAFDQKIEMQNQMQQVLDQKLDALLDQTRSKRNKKKSSVDE